MELVSSLLIWSEAPFLSCVKTLFPLLFLCTSCFHLLSSFLFMSLRSRQYFCLATAVMDSPASPSVAAPNISPVFFLYFLGMTSNKNVKNKSVV